MVLYSRPDIQSVAEVVRCSRFRWMIAMLACINVKVADGEMCGQRQEDLERLCK